MKFKRTIIYEIDVDGFRKEILEDMNAKVKKNDDHYSKKMGGRLLKMLDLFEQGKFKECEAFIAKWSGERYGLGYAAEYIPEAIEMMINSFVHGPHGIRESTGHRKAFQTKWIEVVKE